jgi:hypothetical protein
MLAALAATPFLFAQSAPGAAGQWEGKIQTPGPEIGILINLAKAGDTWKGTIAIPEQNLKGFPLSDISVNGSVVKFAMKGVPGDPTFDGKLAADGKTIAGNFTQSGTPMTFTLSRTGDARIEEPAKSTPLAKQFEGTWEGALDAMGTKLRLVCKLANKEGVGAGTLTSVDQGNAEIPISSVTQKDSSLVLEVSAVGGTYKGNINAAGNQLTGTWTQGMGSLPLVLNKKQ